MSPMGTRAMTDYGAVLHGSFGIGNLGDDLLLLANANVLKRFFAPSALGAICHENDYVKELVPGINVIHKNSRAQIRGTFFVYAGGTVFYAFEASQLGLLAKISRAVTDPSRALAHICERRSPMNSRFMHIMAVGLGIGPFETRSGQQSKAKGMLEIADVAILRDRLSYELCRSWGFTHVLLGTDICYADNTWGGDQLAASPSQNREATIGIIARDWPHSRESLVYQQNLLKAASVLRRMGHHIQFFAFSKMRDSTWNEMLYGRDETVRVWDPSRDTVLAFCRELATCSIIISARYHGAVLASLLGRPVVCVGIDPKLSMIAEMLRGGAELWGPPFDPSELCQVVDRISRNYSSVVASLSDAVSAQQEKAHEMVSQYAQYIQDNLPSP